MNVMQQTIPNRPAAAISRVYSYYDVVNSVQRHLICYLLCFLGILRIKDNKKDFETAITSKEA